MIDVQLEVTKFEAGGIATNAGDRAVYVFDSSRLPYLLLGDDGRLTLFHGINPLPDDIDLYGFQVLPTRVLAPGESFETTRSLDPLVLSNHYGSDPGPTALHGEVPIVATVGWLDEPVLPDELHLWPLERVMAAQKLVTTAPSVVRFP